MSLSLLMFGWWLEKGNAVTVITLIGFCKRCGIVAEPGTVELCSLRTAVVPGEEHLACGVGGEGFLEYQPCLFRGSDGDRALRNR